MIFDSTDGLSPFFECGADVPYGSQLRFNELFLGVDVSSRTCSFQSRIGRSAPIRNVQATGLTDDELDDCRLLIDLAADQLDCPNDGTDCF